MTTKFDEKCCTCKHERQVKRRSLCSVCNDYDIYEHELIGLTDFTEHHTYDIRLSMELILVMADNVTDETTRKTIIELAEETIIRCNAIQTRVEEFINDD